MFSCEFCEIFKNSHFEEHLRTTASKLFVTPLSLTLNFERNLSVVWKLGCSYKVPRGIWFAFMFFSIMFVVVVVFVVLYFFYFTCWFLKLVEQINHSSTVRLCKIFFRKSKRSRTNWSERFCSEIFCKIQVLLNSLLKYLWTTTSEYLTSLIHFVLKWIQLTGFYTMGNIGR